jgi:DNA-binding NtrC family response regulator
LLRVLDHGEYRPLGGESVRVNVRVIGATNKDDSVFLHDFRARFKDSLGIPPLRERREDIPLLVRHWCSRLRKKTPDLVERFFQKGPNGTFEPRIHGRVIDYLLSQPLPCNVRELEQVLVMCLKASPEDVLRLPASLDASVTPPQAEPPMSASAEEETTARGDDKPSREKVLAYLERAEWNVSRAAKAIGLQRSKFYRLMEEYRIKKDPTDPM